jgi:uncharacterized protein YjbI with pentapeptide repeats
LLIATLVGALVIVGLLLAWAYRSQAHWTGFVGYARPKSDDQDYVPGKTLWDWLQLLLIPATLSAAVLLFNNWQGNRDRERAERQALADRQVAIDDQRERALQTFFDEMSDLMLTEDLRESKPGSDVRTVARTRALSTLSRLDGVRKGSLVRFLDEARLLQRPTPVVNLVGADLSGAQMREMDLDNAFLQSVNLYRANLTLVNLRGADLRDAVASRACLSSADLDQAMLDGASFNGSFMALATLDGASTQLLAVSFRSAYLDAASGDTNFEGGARFTGAYVSDRTDLDANLSETQPLPKEADVIEEWQSCFSSANQRFLQEEGIE